MNLGSGITGTVFARTLLDGDRSLEVVTLEARDACSDDHLDLKKKPSAEAAKQNIEWFDGDKEKLGRYLEELPCEKGGWGTKEGPAGMRLADAVCGVISMTGGVVHPYRLVAGILSRLLRRTLHSCMNTRLSLHDNIVHAPRGNICAKHIIHATNGWRSHLLAPMREKSFPCVVI